MLGLCICYYNYNYGSMLQAYATVKEIEKRGKNYRIICYQKEKTVFFVIKNSFRIFNRTWRYEKGLSMQKALNCKINKEYAKNVKRRNKCFVEFQRKYFDSKLSTYIGYDALKKGALDYSAVLVGSDQMWSPSGLATNFYNLMFVPDNVKKISYAASFGVSEIPFYQKKRTVRYLKRIEFLSVRENAAVRIIKNLTARNAMIAVDPTMLLDRKDWDEFSGFNRVIQEKYIFAYFLGRQQFHRQAVRELKKKTGLKIVTLRHLDEYISADETFGDEAPYDIGPKEFINLIKNAEYICTDSFHGSIFSSLFQKQFLTFYRYDDNAGVSKNSRIISLLENLGLSDRIFMQKDIMEQIEKTIDYGDVEQRRKELIVNSKKFLDRALEGVE